MRRLLALVLVAAAAMPGLAAAQKAETKERIINRSAPICRDLLDAVAPHVRRIKRAETPRAVARHTHRLVRTARPYVKDLADLIPPEGHRRYRRFVNNTFATLEWLDAAADALDARRGRLARRRAQEAEERSARANRAGRRYGLRRVCTS